MARQLSIDNQCDAAAHPLSERGGRRPGCVAPSSPHIGVSSNSFDSCSKKFKGLKRLKRLKGLKRVERVLKVPARFIEPFVSFE
jgi:hypothetical protein